MTINTAIIRGILVIHCLALCARAPAQPPAIGPARDHAKAVFDARCKSCHSMLPRVAPFFEASGLPKVTADNLSKVVYATQHVRDLAKPMPPDRKLDASELSTIERWAAAELALLAPPPIVPPVVVVPPGGVSPVVPPPPVAVVRPPCELLAFLPPEGRAPLVTDAAAHEIMGRACAKCHAGDEDQLKFLGHVAEGGAAASFGALLARKLWNMARGKPAVPVDPNAPRPGLCRRALSWFTLNKAIAGVGLASLGGVAATRGQNLHTFFLNGDGSLDAAAMARGDEGMGMILMLVSGRDGKGVMPPYKMARDYPFLVGHYNDDDKKKLISWLEAQTATDLPEACQALPLNTSLNYDGASRGCSALGMRLPTAGQLEKLTSAFPRELGNTTCLWSSSFSNDGAAPRRAWQAATKTVNAAIPSDSCHAVCVR